MRYKWTNFHRSAKDSYPKKRSELSVHQCIDLLSSGLLGGLLATLLGFRLVQLIFLGLKQTEAAGY